MNGVNASSAGCSMPKWTDRDASLGRSSRPLPSRTIPSATATHVLASILAFFSKYSTSDTGACKMAASTLGRPSAFTVVYQIASWQLIVDHREDFPNSLERDRPYSTPLRYTHPVECPSSTSFSFPLRVRRYLTVASMSRASVSRLLKPYCV